MPPQPAAAAAAPEWAALVLEALGVQCCWVMLQCALLLQALLQQMVLWAVLWWC